VTNPADAFLGILLLASGALLCAIANTDVPLRWRHPSAESQSDLQITEASHCTEHRKAAGLGIATVAMGLALAVTGGLMDGSLMVPYKLYGFHAGDGFPKSLKEDAVGGASVSTLHAASKAVGIMEDAATTAVNATASAMNITEQSMNDTATGFSDVEHLVHNAGKAMFPVRRWPMKLHGDDAYKYLQGMAYGHLAFALLMLVILKCFDSREFVVSLKTCGAAGLSAGCFWSVGNFCSIHASEYLGVGLGFPLTQTCCGVAAILAITILGEMPFREQRLCCCFAIILLVLGSSLLTAAH